MRLEGEVLNFKILLNYYGHFNWLLIVLRLDVSLFYLVVLLPIHFNLNHDGRLHLPLRQFFLDFCLAFFKSTHIVETIVGLSLEALKPKLKG
jgi:hypothetical protein